MPSADRLYWIHALTPLHVGAGKGEGYIDLPLIREKVTNFPFIPGSSIKGVFADNCQATENARDPKASTGYKPELHAAFGRTGDDTANAGALVFTDARLICLPVRSLYGTFAWCTTPFILNRFKRDCESAGFSQTPDPPPPLINQAHVSKKNDGSVDSDLVRSGNLYLEDLDLTAQACPTATLWADFLSQQLFSEPTWQTMFRKRFVVLPEDVFNFLVETGTEVQPHIAMEEGMKRVAEGALWYEESLPAEAILCGLLWCDEPRIPKTKLTKNDVLNLLPQTIPLQMGGKATTGKGRVQMSFKADSASSATLNAESKAGGEK